PPKGLESELERLESELERLKRLLNLGHELKLEWRPGRVKHFRGKQLSGEVLGDTIYIYEGNEEKALSTLGHELLDYAVCRVIEPYKSITNKLISDMNEEAYRKKKKLIERLSTLRLPDEDAARGSSNERRPSGGLLETAKAEVKRRAKPSERLESELERLKRALDLGHELRVEWHPGRVEHFRGKQLSGDVLDGTICIYERDEEKALVTLRREFFDYAVYKVVEPYRSIGNKLISIMNDEAHRKKENLVERLCKLVD
ncbi:unnamed protein product, partial [marine sediment metagenome]